MSFAHLRYVAVACVVASTLLIASGCTPTGADDGAARSAVEEAVGAEDGLSDSDMQALTEEFPPLPRRWNEISGRFVAGYVDPSVSADAWVAAGREQVVQLRSIVREFDAVVASLDDPGFARSMARIGDNYRDKLAAVESLVEAVARGDVAAEEAAASELTQAAEAGQQLALTLLEQLREFMTPAELDRFEDMLGSG